jgi:hypothetical protein
LRLGTGENGMKEIRKGYGIVGYTEEPSKLENKIL